jgi:PilZ domain
MTDSSSDSTQTGVGTGAERRGYHRHPFVALAEVTEANSGRREMAQTIELSSSGCYMGTPSPFPEGTLVQLKLSKDDRVFEAAARVLRVHAEFGMGLAFESISPQHEMTLLRWLSAAHS